MTPETKKDAKRSTLTDKPRTKKKAKAGDPSKKTTRPREDSSGVEAKDASVASPTTDPANDERKLARGAAIAIPITTVFASAVVAVILSAGPALLVLGAGTILGTIALFWASLRTLTGDAPLSEELEHASFSASNDALADRKRMLLRALKDLESEQSVGKIDAKDYATLSTRYREEIKELMREMDESIEPHVIAAEAALKKHLSKVGLAGEPFRSPGRASQAKDEALAEDETAGEDSEASADEGPVRPLCKSCETSNEIDARFCKSCGAALEAPGVEQPKNLDALFEPKPASEKPGDVTSVGVVAEAPATSDAVAQASANAATSEDNSKDDGKDDGKEAKSQSSDEASEERVENA